MRPAGARQPLQCKRLSEGPQAVRQLADELKAESDRLLHVDPKGALRTAERISELAESVQDSRIRALAELAVGDALRMLGRFGEALAAYARSADLYLESNDEIGWARTRIGASVTWRYTGVGPAGLEEIGRARKILKRHRLWLRLARLEQHAGILLCERGHFAKGTEAYERALEAARKIEPRDEPQEARILGNLAMALRRLGDYERAETLHAEALAVFESHGQLQELALAQANSAQLLVDRAHYSRALEMATSARRTFLELKRASEAAFVGRVAVHCLLELNRFEDAVALASLVADEFEQASAAINQAGTLVLRSIGLRRLDCHDEALADLTRAETVFAAADCRSWVAVVRVERAALLGSNGEWSEAATEAEHAADELAQTGQVVNSAQARLRLGLALQQTGDYAGAQAAFAQALEQIDGRGVAWLEYQLCRAAGRLALETGDPETALPFFVAAVDALEQVQGRILTEARATFLTDKLDVYEAAVGLHLAQGNAASAFELAERAKSRALVDALAGRLDIRVRPRDASQQQLADELTRLRRRHEQLVVRAASAFDPSEDTQASPPEVNADELAECESRITALLDELRLNGVDDLERIALLQGRVYPLGLEPGTRLIEYFACGEDLCVFVASSAGVQARRLTGAGARVERRAGVLQLAMQTVALAHEQPEQAVALENNARRVLQSLYVDLVQPVEDLLRDAERLLIVPHGVLHRVPFAALHDGEQYLIERFEIVHGPSASALAFCRRPLAAPSGRALVVAFSDNGALPGAVREAEQIAALFEADSLLERQAVRSEIAQRAPTAELIHFATHGQARIDAPLFSYLRLADGYLTALDCFDLQLDCALITLSACDSGRGVVVAGDESVGLPRALLYAGARSVVQTLWRIDDETTALLMEQFYRGLQNGLGRAEALRGAQLAVLAQQPHPFFWAPVVLIGDWGPLSQRSIRHD
jgi:CHAT domain-containing protein